MRYKYADQLAAGRDTEDRFSAWLRGHGRHVRAATLEEQYSGIDMWVSEHDGGRLASVEVKDDRVSVTSGNAFIETVSSVAKGSDGWALTCSAEWLAVVSGDVVYWLRPGEVRARVAEWSARCREVTTQNDSGNTRGVLVPLGEIEALAEAVCLLPSTREHAAGLHDLRLLAPLSDVVSGGV